jgi:hypothetical protein
MRFSPASLTHRQIPRTSDAILGTAWLDKEGFLT